MTERIGNTVLRTFFLYQINSRTNEEVTVNVIECSGAIFELNFQLLTHSIIRVKNEVQDDQKKILRELTIMFQRVFFL